MKAIIIGGGIGGLTAAIALQRAGIEAHVYERAERLREIGAGISLWENAVDALDTLGLMPAIRGAGWSPVRGDLRTRRGTLLSRSASEGRDALVVGAMHRADLQAVLAGAVDPAHLHLGHECGSLDADGDGVTARFANGTAARGDLLIGADGLHSLVRAHRFGGSPPRYAGYTAWRNVVRFGSSDLVAGETWHRGRRFGRVPLSDGRVYWFAVSNAPEGGRDSADGTRRDLLRLFQGWHTPIEALIDQSDQSDQSGGSTILRNDIYDREPLSSWTSGRVTLLGDAAHPMTPNLGQGACQAIEDAVVLAACLASAAGVDAALARYEGRRMRRTARIVRLSRRIGDMAQWEHPLACAARDLLLRATPAAAAARQLQSIVREAVLTPEERARLGTAHPRA